MYKQHQEGGHQIESCCDRLIVMLIGRYTTRHRGFFCLTIVRLLLLSWQIMSAIVIVIIISYFAIDWLCLAICLCICLPPCPYVRIRYNFVLGQEKALDVITCCVVSTGVVTY